MKGVFKGWIALESCKLVLILISISLYERTLVTIVLLSLLLTLTVVSYVKIWPLFKQITNKLFVEDELQNRQLLSRTRLILLALMLFDLIPFLPVIQAILRYEYHKRSAKIDQIIHGVIEKQ